MELGHFARLWCHIRPACPSQILPFCTIHWFSHDSHRLCEWQLKVPIRIAFSNSNHIGFCDSYPNTICISCASSIINAIRIQKCDSHSMQIAYWMRVSSLCAICISHGTCIEHDSYPRCKSYALHATRIWMRITSPYAVRGNDKSVPVQLTNPRFCFRPGGACYL